jgi:hypothetical protein
VTAVLSSETKWNHLFCHSSICRVRVNAIMMTHADQ